MNTVTQQTPQAAARHQRSAPGNPADRAVKRQRVLDILDAAGRDSLLLTTNTALTWYLDGSRVHISLAGDPIAAMLVDRDGDHLVTFNNEAPGSRRRNCPTASPSTQCPGTGSCMPPHPCSLRAESRWRRPTSPPN